MTGGRGGGARRLKGAVWTALASVSLAACAAGQAAPPRATTTWGAAEVPVDGGTDFYSRWPRSFPADPGFFPIGVWLPSVTAAAEVEADRRAGINTYVGLTANSTLRHVQDGNMTALLQSREWLGRVGTSAERIGWLLADEVDMSEGPGRGYRTLERVLRGLPADGRVRYNNYGKGVLFWQADDEAARFVNDYQEIVSADAYWFTDLNLCGSSEGGALAAHGGRDLAREHCHTAANYGRTVARLRSLVRPRGARPVWVVVELGHPSDKDDWPTIGPSEVHAAVWSGVVNGARGILYFNHSFGGQHPTHNVLRDPDYSHVRRQVEKTNGQVAALGEVLSTDDVRGMVQVDGDVDVLVKHLDGSLYILAVSAAPARQVVSMRVACPASVDSVEVLHEDRTLPVTSGGFRDVFEDGNSVHLYKLDGSTPCVLP